VDRVSTISADKTRAVKLNLDTDRVTLSVINPESGTATEQLGANYTADAIEIGFQCSLSAGYHRTDRGQGCALPSCRCRLNPPLIEDTEDKRTLYVLMPMRVLGI